MERNTLLTIACAASFLPLLASLPGDTLWRGSIKFPLGTKNITPVRIYYAGSIIENMYGSSQVLFDIPESGARTKFCLLITDHIDFISEQNTVKYLRIPEHRPYKLYGLEFDPAAVRWHITAQEPDTERRIPDNAVIVCLHPYLVKNIEGGNNLELPKIILDDRFLAQLSDEEMHDAFTHFLLTSIDSDSIHARQNVHIKPDFAKKTIISMICT